MLWLGIMAWSLIGVVAGLVGIAEVLVLLFVWGAASAEGSIEAWARRDAQRSTKDEHGVPYL